MKSMHWRRWLGLAGGLMVAGAAWAQPADKPAEKPADKPAEKPAAPAADLPKAADIIKTFVEKTGGRAAYEKIKSRVTHAKLEMAGMKGTMTMWQAGGKTAAKTEIEGLGVIEQGTDGSAAWETNPMTGARLLEGKEKAVFTRQSTLNGELNWEKLYKKAETTGEDVIDGKPHWRVVMTTMEDEKLTSWYDKASGLLTKVTMTMESPMGAMSLESFISDYKTVDGVMFPHKTLVKVMGMEQVLTIEKLEHNTDIPAEKFNPPADVKKLLEKPKEPEKKDDEKKPEGK